MALASRQMDFSFLDGVEFKKKYTSGEDQDHIRFFIEGISCGKCVRKLEDIPLHVPGVLFLRIQMGKHIADVKIDSSLISFSEVATHISLMGFNPIPLSAKAEDENLQEQEDRNDLVRLGVSGALAGNIMSFSLATYFGATSEFALFFSWLSFALYLPVVTYVAKPFYLGAWNSLKRRQLSIDFPMAFASLAGFVFSTFQLVRGQEDIYFDSLSGFLFLILLSRFIHKRVQRRFLRPSELSESLQIGKVRRVDAEGWRWTPTENIVRGDRLLLLNSETLPVDAKLLANRAHFSMAWLTGESEPQTFLYGALIPAGARLLDSNAELVCSKILSDTHFGRLLKQVQLYALSKNHLVNMADKWAQGLLAVVFTVAALFLILYWPTSSEEAIRRSLALIILACPCAMAFGTPLALASALKRSHRSGLIVKDANVFSLVRKVKTIFFDKTGTLTEARLSLNENPESVPQVYQKIILSLENKSMHPIAFAFREAFFKVGSLPPAEGFQEIPGKGVSGFVFGKFYQIKANTGPNKEIGCTLYEEEKPIVSLSFSAQIKEDCEKVLRELRNKGFQLKLVSGDKRDVALALGSKLGFNIDDIFFEMSPDAKAELVGRTPNSMMVGDGINDSLALMRADVGVAASGGVESALKSSQIYLTRSGLGDLTSLFKISNSAYSLLKSNLILSFGYNTLGGVLALLGFINPLAAAILMPLSSGLILLNTLIRGYPK